MNATNIVVLREAEILKMLRHIQNMCDRHGPSMRNTVLLVSSGTTDAEDAYEWWLEGDGITARKDPQP